MRQPEIVLADDPESIRVRTTRRRPRRSLSSMVLALSVISQHAYRQVVLSVDLEARDGRRWRAIGGGSSLEEALTFARESAPDGHYWRVVKFEDLYGD